MTESTGKTELGEFLIKYTEFTYEDIWDAWSNAVQYGKAIALNTDGSELDIMDFGTWLHKRFAHLEPKTT